MNTNPTSFENITTTHIYVPIFKIYSIWLFFVILYTEMCVVIRKAGLIGLISPTG